MLLSRKQKTFSPFIFPFLKFSLNSEHFQKKMTLMADVFPKLRTPKNMVRLMPKKSRLRASVEKKRGKCVETLFKFEEQLLSHF